jgi:predicted nucleic acid-binding Zn ribbon protein
MNSKELIRSIINDKGTLHFSKGCRKKYKDLYDEICENTKFLNHLNPRIIDRALYYINDIEKPGNCIECNTEIVRLGSTFCTKRCMDSSDYLKKRKEETSMKKYGVTNVSKSSYFKERYKNTMREKYGVDHYSKTSEYSEKYKTTMNERYGVENPMKSDEIKHKMIQNSLEKNGVEWSLSLPEVQQKIKDTWKARGFKRNSSTQEWSEKTKETSREKYGTNHPMQNEEYFEKCMKNSRRFKEYVLPSGRVVKVQGFENLALDKLLETYKEEDLIIGTKEIKSVIGRIDYIFEGKTKIYHPDIYIVSENKVIEVKSTYTIKVDVEKNEAKRKAVLDKGMNFEFMIF